MADNLRWKWESSLVTRVVDGDTVVARLTRDVGFHGVISFEQRLRLNRINTAKGTTAKGKAATHSLKTMLDGVSVSIETLKPYKYGDEFMCEIVLPDGRNVSDALIAGGFATLWDGKGARPSDS